MSLNAAIIEDFLREQCAEWPLAGRNFGALEGVEVRRVEMPGWTLKVQFNPARIVSSGAKVDARSLAERPCFLCEANRPAEQRGLEWGDGRYTVLVNPFPIFPRHLTIPATAHTPQRIKGRVADMLRLAGELEGYTVFYNGPRCGASAPDHMHFQAGNSDFLTIAAALEDAELQTVAENAEGGVLALCTALLLVGRRRSVLARSGFASFYMAKLDNTRRLQAYPTARARRRKGIDAVAQGSPYPGPSTIVLVIGESANRDYMSSFAPHLKRDTTPWLRACHEDDPKHWMLFPNAYSCGMHTFMALEQGLTEANQTAPDGFVNAASIVDMARAAGRRVHWYSNQGHLGASLSQVSVVADEADETLWTQQKPGLPPYDTELLPFLDRVDPTKDNLVVLHLKGNHFSFENRYPADEAVWKPDGDGDSITTYMNSIHYVDALLRQVWERASQRLNMKAMVYCSDHAIIPDCHRAPTFTGFGDVRIPLAVWTSEDFITAHPDRHAALQANTGRYWTNDFLYDLVCGLMDLRSPRFNTANSLAHREYAHTRESLTILGGTIAIADDK